MRALVVDDDRVSLSIIKKLLEKRGHEVTACQDPDSAWRAFQLEHFPLIILDWLLPGSDGLELCRRMRASPFGHSAVIVVVTSCNAPEDLKAVLEAGADDYLAKPIDLDLFTVRLVIAERHVKDIEERKNLEETILGISTDEKERIGQDLHDTVGQTLTGIGFLVGAIEKKLENRSTPTIEDITKIRDLINNAVNQARHLAKGLFPVEMVSGGLHSAICDLASTTESLFNVNCKFNCRDRLVMEDHQVASQLYRIIQEAVNNSVKHANASKITINIVNKNDILIIGVTDDGIGISEAAIGRGMGLSIMQYRARCINASLEVGLSTSGGTRITCSYSLQGKLRKLG